MRLSRLLEVSRICRHNSPHYKKDRPALHEVLAEKRKIESKLLKVAKVAIGQNARTRLFVILL